MLLEQMTEVALVIEPGRDIRPERGGYVWGDFNVLQASTSSLAQRMAYRDFRFERFLALNGLQPGARLEPGRKVKLVVMGTRQA